MKVPFRQPLLALAAWATGLLSAPSGEASALIDNLNAGKDQTLVLYGTSLTQYGRWADLEPGHGGLSDWLAGLYGSRITVINSGMAGLASNSGVANLGSKVLDFHPDTVLIEFAINDAHTNYTSGQVDFNISLEQSKANLNTMIDSIWADNPQAEIILLTMNPAFDIAHYLSGTYRPELEAYYQGYRDVAAQRGIQLIDLYANWVELRETDPSLYATYFPDGLHPTAPGSLAIALPALKEALLIPEASSLVFFLSGVALLGAGILRNSPGLNE